MKRYTKYVVPKYVVPTLLTMTVLTTLFLLISGGVGASSLPQGRSPIPGHLIPALTGKTPTGAPDGQQTLHLTISLHLADPAGLQALITAQNDKHSSAYHHYLTPQQFTTRFAPSQANVNAVVSFLRSQGLTVKSVAANHLIIDTEGTVATVEQALNVHIANYSLNGHTVFAPSNEPSVPASLAGLILNISGLDNVSTPHRLGALAPKQNQTPATGPNGGYTPSELRTAYDMNNLINTDNGSGQTVALVELDGYNASDINTYLSHYGLGSANYSNELLDGATATPGSNADEVELDMEVVSAIAPGASQRIYIAPNTFQGFLDAFNQIVTDDTAQVTSNSWGNCEANVGTSAMQAFDTVFSAGAAQGQAFFSASGDSGSADCQSSSNPTATGLAVDYPASDPFVVGVGGTTLNTGSGGSYSSEAVWNNSYGSDGGGLSTFFAQPGYQSGPGVTNSFSNGKREVPDVSADADPGTGYSIYCTVGAFCQYPYYSGWTEFGGTSAAAPLWAGIATDINEYLAAQSKPTLGSASVYLYQVFNTPQALTAYHDITSGNNDNNGLNGGDYPATSGYDMASGIGTPDVWYLAQDVANDVPVLTPNLISLVTQPGVNPAAQTVTFQNNSSNSYNWSLSGLQSWLSADHTSGTIAPHSSGQFKLTFTLGNSPQTYTTNLTVKDTSGVFNPLTLPVTVVAANVAKTWYFAEGYTGTGFTEYLTVANPNPTSTTLTVQYLLQGASPVTKQYSVAANSRFTLNINAEIGANQNVSLVVTGSQPIIAERPMYFTFPSGAWKINLPGGSDVLGATSLGTDFAFGYLDTTTNHDTYLTILNQDPTTPMQVSVSYFPAAGGTPKVIPHTVPANSRGTIHVNDEHLPLGTYSALVHLSLPGLVERPMYLKDAVTGNTGAGDVVGVTQPLTDWYFAEGFVDPTFSERYILSNPGGTSTAQATITFYGSSGTLASRTVILAPGQQQVVDVNAVLGSSGVNNSAEVVSTEPILAERFMSFKFSPTIPGATDVLGASAPGNLFYFAEGFTGSGFSEYLTIENPNPSQTATVQVTYLPSTGGASIVQVYSITPRSRFTLNTVQVINASFANQSFSMVVESNVPIVAERPMYFNFAPGKTGGSDIIGYQAPGTILPPPPPPAPSTIYIGSEDGHEYALDASTGTEKWSTGTSNGVNTAVVGNGIVYAASGANIFAMNAQTGAILWTVQTSPTAFLTLANGILYFGSGLNSVEAYYAVANKPAWSFATGNIVADAPTVVNGVVYVGSDDHYVYALDANTGTLLWRFQTGGSVRSSPEVVNGVVYVGSDDHNVYALDASTGAKLWSFQTGNAVRSSPTVANGVVYVGSYDSAFYALDANTGAKLWSYQISTPYTELFASKAVVANGVVFVTGVNNSKLYALNANTGVLLWSFQMHGAPSSPLFFNGLVYVGCQDENVYAVDASTGAQVWSFRTQNAVYADPVIG